MSRGDVHFGSIIRAARLGFRGAGFGWMRISPHPKGFYIEILPNDAKSEDFPKKTGELYYCWWESGEGQEIIKASPALRGIKAVRKPLKFVMDDDGRVVLPEGVQ